MTMQPFECAACGIDMEFNTEYCDACEESQNEETEPFMGQGEFYIDHDVYHDQFEREYGEPNPLMV